MPQGIEESFRQIRDVQANHSVRMGVNIRVPVMTVDPDVGRSNFSGDTNAVRSGRLYLNPGMLSVELTGTLENVLR